MGYWLIPFCCCGISHINNTNTGFQQYMIEIVAKIVVIVSTLNQIYINISRQYNQIYLKLPFGMQIYQVFFVSSQPKKRCLYQLSKESFFSLALQGSEPDSNFQVFFHSKLRAVFSGG